jgi:hypothetical protein
MKTRLILTLLLILLAAVIAAAAIFFLMAQSGPAPSPAPPRAGPSLTIVAESISDQATGEALAADVYFNGTLSKSLGKSALRPQHYTAKRYSATNLEYNEWLSGRENSFVSQFVVVPQPQFQVTVPMDGSAEIRVAAPGYKPWGIRPRGGGSDKVMKGPVQLVRE